MLSWGTAFGLPGSSAETSLQDQRCAVRCEASRSSAFAFCREFRAVCDQSLQILQSVSPSGASGSSGVGGARQDGQDDQDWLHPPPCGAWCKWFGKLAKPRLQDWLQSWSNIGPRFPAHCARFWQRLARCPSCLCSYRRGFSDMSSPLSNSIRDHGKYASHSHFHA